MFKYFFILLLFTDSTHADQQQPLSVNNLSPLLNDITQQKTPYGASLKLQKFLEEATLLGIQALEKSDSGASTDKIREIKEDILESIGSIVDDLYTSINID